VRKGLRALAGALLLAVSLTAFATARPAAAASNLSPLFECSFKVSNGNYQTVWGYDNQTGSVQDLPVGTNNRFTTPTDRGQPTTFQIGRHDNVVVVPWNGTSRLRWRLNDNRAVASTSPVCAANPVPITGTGLSSVVAVSALAVMGVAVDQFLRRRRRRARAASP